MFRFIVPLAVALLSACATNPTISQAPQSTGQENVVQAPVTAQPSGPDASEPQPAVGGPLEPPVNARIAAAVDSTYSCQERYGHVRGGLIDARRESLLALQRAMKHAVVIYEKLSKECTGDIRSLSRLAAFTAAMTVGNYTKAQAFHRLLRASRSNVAEALPHLSAIAVECRNYVDMIDFSAAELHGLYQDVTTTLHHIVLAKQSACPAVRTYAASAEAHIRSTGATGSGVKATLSM